MLKQWLADREKKLQKRKKHQKEAEEKENEKKQKDIEERALEGESARRAWLKNKEVFCFCKAFKLYRFELYAYVRSQA